MGFLGCPRHQETCLQPSDFFGTATPIGHLSNKCCASVPLLLRQYSKRISSLTDSGQGVIYLSSTEGPNSLAIAYRRQPHGKSSMHIEVTDLGVGVTKVDLTGRLDIAGAQEVDLPLSVIAGSKAAVVFDLSKVTFLASIGLRSILISAKTIKSKGGRLVILSPASSVEEVLMTTRTDTLIAIYHDLDAAIAAVTS